MIQDVERKTISKFLSGSLPEKREFMREAKAAWFQVYHEEAAFLFLFYEDHHTFPSQDALSAAFPKFEIVDKCREPMSYYLHHLKDARLFNIARQSVFPLLAKIQSSEAGGFEIADTLRSIISRFDVTTSSSLHRVSDDNFRQRYADKKYQKGVYYYPHLPSFRGAVNRMVPGNLWTMYARPATGKTWLSCSFALDAAINQGIRTALHSPEMSKEEIQDRLYGILGGIDWQAFSVGESSFTDLLKIRNARRKLAEHSDKLLLFGNDTASSDIRELPPIIQDNEIRFLVIDGAHNLNVGFTGSMVERVYDTCTYMKQGVARGTNTMVFQTVQEKRSSDGKARGSGQAIWGDVYEQESDVYFLLSGDPRTPVRTIDLKKVRNGIALEFMFQLEMNPVYIGERLQASDGIEVELIEI